MGKYPQYFAGEAGFNRLGEVCKVNKVIFRSPNDLVVEFVYDNWLYTVQLMSADGIHYEGEYIARKADEVDKGRVTCSLFTAGDDKLLFGHWIEEGSGFWWVNLEKED